MIRFLVLAYFPLFILSEGLVDLTGNALLRAVFVVPPAGYAAWRVLVWGADVTTGRNPTTQTGRTALVALVYTGLYGSLFFFRAYTGVAAAGSFAALATHALFWHVAFWARPYRRRRSTFFNDLVGSIALASCIGLLGALSYVGWSVEPGVVHNLAGEAPMVRSDLDVPLMASVVGVWAIVALFRRGPHRRAGLRGLLGVLGLVWAAFIVILYARRTPLFALLGAGAVLLAPGRLRAPLGVATLLLPFVPLYWDAILVVLVPLTQNRLAEAVFARNTAEDYLSATNRLGVWLASFDYLRAFRLEHLIGYGGAPAQILPLGWTQTHNAFLQLVFDAGLPILLLVIHLIVAIYRRLFRLLRWGMAKEETLFLLGALVVWMMLSGVEPGLRAVTIVHMLFLTISISAANLYMETGRSRAGEEIEAQVSPANGSTR